MGSVTYIAHSNEFWVNNLHEFRDGLKGYVGGEWESEVAFHYSDFKRRSKNALIKMDSTDFSIHLHKKGDYEDELNLLEHIQKHISKGQEAVIHLVAYEHPGDMCITRYMVTDFSMNTTEILEN